MVIMLVVISCVLKIKFGSSYSILIDTTLFAVAFSMFVTKSRKGGKRENEPSSTVYHHTFKDQLFNIPIPITIHNLKENG